MTRKTPEAGLLTTFVASGSNRNALKHACEVLKGLRNSTGVLLEDEVVTRTAWLPTTDDQDMYTTAGDQGGGAGQTKDSGNGSAWAVTQGLTRWMPKIAGAWGVAATKRRDRRDDQEQHVEKDQELRRGDTVTGWVVPE
ncbi:hypothetical protein PHYBOEH_003766 [Phytophthora boehmeriae]|uniref:Uncharacterized protein n=1 Tax=Phytophthora boehmeriae TaxID=109152 RepID=A0A8T1WNB8_9STRA|nr:hypothetical protein PHYBOEH_003766 [Phytophthora boehmeriae]